MSDYFSYLQRFHSELQQQGSYLKSMDFDRFLIEVDMHQGGDRPRLPPAQHQDLRERLQRAKDQI